MLIKISGKLSIKLSQLCIQVIVIKLMDGLTASFLGLKVFLKDVKRILLAEAYLRLLMILKSLKRTLMLW